MIDFNMLKSNKINITPKTALSIFQNSSVRIDGQEE